VSRGARDDSDHASAPLRKDGRTEALFAALLFVLALAPRVYVALAWAGEPVWDGHYYDFGARRIAAGFGYSDDRSVAGGLVWHPWCHYPVGYSAFLAVFYRVFGASHAVAAVANALVGAALAPLTWALARHGLSRARSRIAGLIVALHPGLILYAALVMSEPLAALLTLTAFWLAVRDGRPGRALAKGALALGVAALVRPQALLCAPFLPSRNSVEADASVRAERIRARASAALIAGALALIPVLPWTLRNCRVMDGCALVSTNGGWNLAIGAFPRATGRFETLRSSDGCSDVTGQVQQDRCWFEYGLAQIRAHPARWLSLIPAKLGFTFDHESFAVEYLREAKPESWPDARRVTFRGWTSFVHRLLVAVAALGMVAFPLRAKPRAAAMQGGLLVVACLLGAFAVLGDAHSFWPLALFAAAVPWIPVPGRPSFPPALLLSVVLVATTAVTHAVFFGEDRYHVVVTPVLALLAAAALRRPARALARQS
jgi:4-amino-4-deoxy-L-arabinose transferase-like glycosyltransferase